MPRRCWILQAVVAMGLVMALGCRGQVDPKPDQTIAAPSPPAQPAQPAQPVVRMRISPEAFTITADDPGLQLLAAEETAGSRDRTTEVQWTAEPVDLAAMEAGGYLRPKAPGW